MIFFKDMLPPIFFDFPFWTQFLYFWIIVFISFFIPGSILIRKVKLPFFEHAVLSTVTGMVLWGWQGFIFGYLNLRFLTYIYLALCFLVFLYTNRSANPRLLVSGFRKIKIDLLLIFILVIGVIAQVAHLWYSGGLFSQGMYFCCGAVGDNLYQLELSYQALYRIPIFEPNLYGIILKNYHYWGNIVIGELSRVFKINLLHLQFQYISVFLSVFLGLSALVIARIINATRLFKRWLLFFLFFGGDFIYLIQYATTRKINFIIGPLENGSSFLLNTPRAFSIILLFCAVALLLVWVKNKKKEAALLSAFLISAAVGFKIYVGIFAIAGFFSLALFFLLKKKFYLIPPCLAIIIFSAIIYLPINKSAGGFFFSGFWRFEDFASNQSLGISNLELARRIYGSHGNILRELEYNLIMMVLFFFAMFGTKIIALIQSRKSLSVFPKELHIFFLFGSLASLLLGSFFLQKTGSGNEFNFIVTVYIVSSFYAALTLGYFFSKLNKKIYIFIILLIFLATIPRVAFEEIHNVYKLQNNGAFILKNDELAGMSYIREKTPKSSLILVYYSNYLASIGEREILSLNNGVQDSHGVILNRTSMVKTITTSKNSSAVYDSLLKNNVSYIYTNPEFSLQNEADSKFLKIVFQNKSIKIYKFNPI